MSAKLEKYLWRLYDDYGFFVHELWKFHRLDKVHPLTWAEYEMMDYAANGPTRKGILAPRGIGKTGFISVPLPLWRLYRNRNRRILIPSKTERMARNIVLTQLRWIKSTPFLQPLTPGKHETQNRSYFEVAGAQQIVQPSVVAFGIGGQLPGNRAHDIIPDDVETPGNTKTAESRLGLIETVKEFENILYESKKHVDGEEVDPTNITYVGTFHHEESLYIYLNDELGYEFRTWPIEVPHKTLVFMGLSPTITRKRDKGELKVGDPVFPGRFNTENVEQKRRALGHHGFAMQAMLNRNFKQMRRYPLCVSDLVVHPCPPKAGHTPIMWGEHNSHGSTAIDYIQTMDPEGRPLRKPALVGEDLVPYGQTIAYMDTAGGGKDQLGLAIGSTLSGRIYINAVRGFQSGIDPETMKQIAMLLREYRVSVVILESNYSGGTYETVFRPALEAYFVKPGETDSSGEFYPGGWICGVESDHVIAQKDGRIIDSLAGPLAQHRLVIDPEAIRPDPAEDHSQHLQLQMARIEKKANSLKPWGGEYGKLDALAGLVRKLGYSMGVDTSKAHEAAVRKQQAELDEKEDTEWRKAVGLPVKVQAVCHRSLERSGAW